MVAERSTGAARRSHRKPPKRIRRSWGKQEPARGGATSSAPVVWAVPCARLASRIRELGQHDKVCASARGTRFQIPGVLPARACRRGSRPGFRHGPDRRQGEEVTTRLHRSTSELQARDLNGQRASVRGLASAGAALRAVAGGCGRLRGTVARLLSRVAVEYRCWCARSTIWISGCGLSGSRGLEHGLQRASSDADCDYSQTRQLAQ